MSKVTTGRENCFESMFDKTKTSCCFSLPFKSHISPCFDLFSANTSDVNVERPLSRPFRYSLGSIVPSKKGKNLPVPSMDAKDGLVDSGKDAAQRATSCASTRPLLTSRETRDQQPQQQQYNLLQNLWLEQQQILTWQRKDEANFVFDKITGKKYRRGRLLGKGAFAKCYELTDLESCAVYAGKIIPKSRLSKPHQREKLEWEVSVHRSLKHENVVAFYDWFEDERNVYIIIEHCRRKSLDHVLKMRKTLTEPEVRYYVRQLVEGCRYIHSQFIIHRDLKLANMLLNGNMHVKIADFGLATRVKYEGEKKMGICGTPNYVAPEVLRQEGHSYEVDLWSIGCIIYTMLCGHPPFEMPTLKETFKRITENKFSLPSYVSVAAGQLINKLLNQDPSARLRLDAVLFEDFFTTGYAPVSLSPSFCERSPKFSASIQLPRPKSLATTSLNPWKTVKSVKKKALTRKMSISQVNIKSAQEVEKLENPDVDHRAQLLAKQEESLTKHVAENQTYSLISMYKLLAGCLQRIPTDQTLSFPVMFCLPISVSKWIDYSNKYGFGFQLSDGSIGVNFNDSTRLILLANSRMLEYIDLSNRIRTLSVSSVPADLQKKFSLLLYFGHYMAEHLKDSVSCSAVSDQALAPITGPAVFLRRWFRTDEALVLYLSNNTVQVNFLSDHTKLILGAVEGQGHVVTYINASSQVVSYRLAQLCHAGCGLEIAVRLRYARRMLETLINYEEESV